MAADLLALAHRLTAMGRGMRALWAAEMFRAPDRRIWSANVLQLLGRASARHMNLGLMHNLGGGNANSVAAVSIFRWLK